MSIFDLSGDSTSNTVIPLGIRTVLIGDSITERNNGCGVSQSGTTVNAPWAAGSTGKAVGYSLDGYFTVLNAVMGAPFRVIWNAGISGQTTTEMLARYTADVLSYSPSCVAIMGGTNDFTGPAVAPATSVSNITTMANQALAIGAYVILFTIPPRNGGGHGSGTILPAARRARKEYINQAIKDYGRGKSNVFVIDTEALTSDYLATTGENGYGGWRTGYDQDGVHPGTLNCTYAMGASGIARLQDTFKPLQLISNIGDTYDGAGSPAAGTMTEGQNIMTAAACFMTDSGGGVSAGAGAIVGAPPTNWGLRLLSGTGLTVTITNPAASDGSTKVLNLSNVVSSGSGQVVILEYFVAPILSTVGKYYEFSGKINFISGQSLIGCPRADIYDVAAVTNNSVIDLANAGTVSGANSQVPTAVTSMTFRTPRYRCTNASEHLDFRIVYSMLGIGTSVIQISNLAVREYSTFN